MAKLSNGCTSTNVFVETRVLDFTSNILTLRFIIVGHCSPVSTSCLCYVISVSRPSPFSVTLLLLCIILNDQKKNGGKLHHYSVMKKRKSHCCIATGCLMKNLLSKMSLCCSTMYEQSKNHISLIKKA